MFKVYSSLKGSQRVQYDGCKCRLVLRGCSSANPGLFNSNIWGPNKQADLVSLLGDHYKFSLRLLAVMQTSPPLPEPRNQENKDSKYRTKPSQKDDVELAATSLDSPRTNSPSQGPQNTSHYTIAKQMLHYHSIDVGQRCEFSEGNRKALGC
jgi:hypothetical protein